MIRRSPLMYALDLPGFGFSDRAEYSLTGGGRRLDQRRQSITKRPRYQAKGGDMPSPIYVNAGEELNLARQVATNVIENRMYAERGLPATLQQAGAWLREAQSEAAQLFHQPAYLATLLAGLAQHDPWLAGVIEEAVHERISGFRQVSEGTTPQTPESVRD